MPGEYFLRLSAAEQSRVQAAAVFVSHDLNLVHRLSERVNVMKQGRIVESGSANHVLNMPNQRYT